jgi:PHD/YefM family antitoxin component YafN of YafNO toxin-antitoxin module
MNKPTSQIPTNVIALGELETHVSESIRAVTAHGRPLLITDGDHPAAIVLPLSEYDRLTDQTRFMSAIRAGLNDLAADRVVTDAELGEQLDAKFGPLADAPPR